MSQTITTAFVQQFNRNVYILAQQRGSKLRSKVRIHQQNGKKAFFDRLAPTEPQRKISRHQDTPLVEQIHSRRAVGLEDWVLADLVDLEDEVRLLISPASLYAANFARGMGRQIDRTIIAALDGDAESGQFGGTYVSFPAGQILASGGATLTEPRVRQVKRIMDAAEVPEEGRVFVVSAQAMEGLLGETKVTSSDYNTIKALVQGTIDGNVWMGFEWIRVADDLLPIDANLDRSCYVFQRDAMGLAMGRDINTSMDRRPDKMNALQVMTTATFGAVRIEEVAVVKVLVREV